MDKETKLKPCPFCNSDAVRSRPNKGMVRCSNTECPLILERTWNTRQTQSQVKEPEYLTDEMIQDHMIMNCRNDHGEPIAVQCNLEPRVQPIRTPKNMSINKLIIYNSIHMLIQQGLAYDLIKRHMLTGVSDKTNRYRKGLELDEIYSENIQGQKMDIEAKELSRIFDLIGWR